MSETLPPGLIFLFTVIPIAIGIFIARRIYQWYDALFPKWTVHEYERAVRYERGKLVGLVEPGQYRFRAATNDLYVYDRREQTMAIPGQEVLSSDSLGFKLSLQANYGINDPIKAQTVVSSYYASLYADIHAATRSVVETMTGDEIMANRAEIGKKIEEIVREAAARYGVEIISLTVRDCMLPGNLKQIYAKVAEAKQEGLAALERARGESAALRNLANAARAMDNNPNLSYLRLLQTIEKNGGSSMFFMPPALSEILRTDRSARPKTGSDTTEDA